MNLNPARLALFTDWAKTLPPRPLPRTVIPVPGEYHLDYIRRVARANYLEFLQLAEIVNDTAEVTLHRGRWEQHQQERLATLASQPLPRIIRLCWPDPGRSIRDPEGFRRVLRPACRRCIARRGITEPVASHLRPHLHVWRRHQLWIGPSARTHADQLDISQLPEILSAQRRHLAQLHHNHWWQVDDAISDAARTSRQALRAGAWTPQQWQRLRQLDPGTWHQAAAGASLSWPGNGTPATRPSRSQSTPTSSDWPHTTSGRGRGSGPLAR